MFWTSFGILSCFGNCCSVYVFFGSTQVSKCNKMLQMCFRHTYSKTSFPKIGVSLQPKQYFEARLQCFEAFWRLDRTWLMNKLLCLTGNFCFKDPQRDLENRKELDRSTGGTTMLYIYIYIIIIFCRTWIGSSNQHFQTIVFNSWHCGSGFGLDKSIVWW